MKDSKIPILKIRMQITGSEAVVNVCGDYHYGARGVEKSEIISALNNVTDRYRGNLFRVITGDLIENPLKTSVGHNYDVAIPDPAIQKSDMIDILKETNEYLYGAVKYKKLVVKPTKGIYEDILSAGVEGNHEYRTRKLAGQWLSSEMFKESKILDGLMNCIIELTIYNKKLKMEKTYKIYLAHRPSKTDATSSESILRAFKKKQSSFPGIDIFIFGHYHKRFVSAGGYYDLKEEKFKKSLYVINPSPLSDAEYADEAGYPPLEIGYYVNLHLPLDPCAQAWAVV